MHTRYSKDAIFNNFGKSSLKLCYTLPLVNGASMYTAGEFIFVSPERNGVKNYLTVL